MIRFTGTLSAFDGALADQSSVRSFFTQDLARHRPYAAARTETTARRGTTSRRPDSGSPLSGAAAELNLEVATVVQLSHVAAVDLAGSGEVPLLERSTVVG